MEPRITTFPEKKLVGEKVRMSFSDNRTFELWHGFMPRLHQIKNTLGSELYSVEVYPSLFWDRFDPAQSFEKWATVEVADFDLVPEGMQTITVPEGLYAVFTHRGAASQGPTTYRYIFGTWLPASAFVVDERPHFAVMGEKYRHESPDSEEDIWIPIRAKSDQVQGSTNSNP